LPKSGVYYVKVKIDDKTYHGMANIGNNPTLNYSFEKRLEIYILDFHQNIYGKTIDITFMHYLRQELKFRNKKELIEQLQKDETAVRKLII
jgi:riboflavin kinase/FMN adenylyltransferase